MTSAHHTPDRRHTSTPATPFSVAAWAAGGMRRHAIRLFWAFSAVVAATFVVSVFNFATQTVLDCPQETQLVGGPPPASFEAFCVLSETVHSENPIRHGPYRRWHATSSAYKGSKLAPDVLVRGAYDRGQKTGEWVTKTRTGAVIERWVEGAPKYAMADTDADLELRITAAPPGERRHLTLDDALVIKSDVTKVSSKRKRDFKKRAAAFHRSSDAKRRQ